MTEIFLRTKYPFVLKLQSFNWNEGTSSSSYFHFPYSWSSRLQVINKQDFGDKVFFYLSLACSTAAKKILHRLFSLLGIL